MIGERLESHHVLPWGTLLFLAVGLGFVAAGLSYGIKGLVIGAVLPLVLGGSLWLLGRERPFTATLREDGLEINGIEGPFLVPYASIQNFRLGGRSADPAKFCKSSCAIAILHEGGVLRVPARLNFPSHEVYRFLAERVPDRGARDVNPVLAEYLEREEQYFGPQSVGTFRAASRRVTGARRGYRAFCIGMMVAGAAWSVVGISGLGEIVWSAAGLGCVLSGALLYASSFAESISPGPMKNWKNASLVIGPQGMAMVQGDVRGEIRWPEVQEVRFNPTPIGIGFGDPSALVPGIVLRVKGAKLLIVDIYDRPLYVIHNRILASSGRSTPPDPEL